MSALREANLEAYPLETQEWFKDVVANIFWNWYAENKETLVTTISVWVFKKKIFVKDLHSLFVILFGEPNGTTA